MKKEEPTLGENMAGPSKYRMKNNPNLLHFSTSPFVSSQIAFDIGFSEPDFFLIYSYTSQIFPYSIKSTEINMSLEISWAELKAHIYFRRFNWLKFNSLLFTISLLLLTNENISCLLKNVVIKESRRPVAVVMIKIDSKDSSPLSASWLRNIHNEITARSIAAKMPTIL